MAGNIQLMWPPMARIFALLLPVILAQPLVAEAQVALPGVRLPGGGLQGLPLNAPLNTLICESRVTVAVRASKIRTSEPPVPVLMMTWL